MSGQRIADLTTSGELIEVLDRVDRLATSAGQPELVERVARARARVAGRGIRVMVVGASGQGVSSLARTLAQTSAGARPGVVYAEPPRRSDAHQVALPDPASADAVLFASDAAGEYTAPELEALRLIRARGLPVAGVITKIDAHSEWSEVQRADRARLRAADLDTPPIPLFPVSAALAETARQRGGEGLVASGEPQLVEFLSEQMSTRVDAATRDAVLAEARTVTDQLTARWTAERDALGGSTGSPAERQRRAVAELERRQQLSVDWQLALGDGMTELMAQVEHDLRNRLRTVVRLGEENITGSDPVPRWPQFDLWLRGAVTEQVQASYQLARERSRRLAREVADRLAGQPTGDAAPTHGLPLPDLRLNSPDETLSTFTPVPTPDSASGGTVARVVNSLRGSYGGVLMVGVVTSLIGMVLINPYSIGAGVLLGVFTFWEDRKAGRERGCAEAKMAVSKLMDEVIFQVGDELRTELRRVHRQLRDHFTTINDGRLRAASDAVRAVADGGRQDPRLAELEANLADLRPLRARLSAPPRPPRAPVRPAGPPPGGPAGPPPTGAGSEPRDHRREASPASRG